MELLCLVIAHVIIRAWEQARAQAGEEWRRARDEWSAEIGRRMAAGAAGGPGESWWWWLAAADRARRSLRGPRPGASATALPGATPRRRIRQAAAAGAAAGSRRGAQRAAERRQARRERRAAAGRTPRPPRTRRPRRTASRAGFAGGYARGFLGGRLAGAWRRWQSRQPAGVCDKCGAVCAAASLEYRHVDAGGRTETLLLCARCRSQPEPGPEPAPVPVPAVAGAQEYAAVTTGRPGDGPSAAGLFGGSGDPVPADTEDEPLPLDAPGPVPAAAGDSPHGELAAGDSPLPDAPDATEITDGGQMSTELELAGNRLPAAGDAYSHGAVARAEQTDADLLDQQQVFVAAMLDDLNAVTASRAQVANVTAWAELVGIVSEMFRQVTAEMGRRYGLVIPVIDAVGRDRVAGRMSYYQEV